ncbi:hypothetical protein AB0N05_23745 [Nocardia sp. NPDC051030]|uniref:hypothetical protein n=1 Tax=Nocardia sp. NPDC051030 TaxID=3155162 RepID=UPI0034350833
MQTLSNYSQTELTLRFGADGYYRNGASADAVNFRDWAVGWDGLRLYFGTIASEARGNIMLTLPWSALQGVLNPNIKSVVGA